jgi:hypothetical protein
MSATILEDSEATILARVVAAESPSLPESVAREILRWGFSEADQKRMSELAAKARAGTLQPSELEESEAFERVSSFLGLVKSKARRSLNEKAGG